MRKLLLGALASTMILTGCATTATDSTTAVGTATNVGMNIFKTAVDTQCRSELNNNNLYKTASLIMTDAQKTSLENKVCGCVSEKAPQSITLVELGQVAIDPSSRTQIVGGAVTKTLNACVSEAVGKI
ncbi:MAG: hypothetical protein Q4B79_03670 [Moraxella sp.]|uniref:hypothetical protein n=1 Tax=Moraxella sp. TaxID=479 RepID=UPI0026DC6C70|nr:hypothetical protein [Moraxella sp.]MDO4450042.1 hypothetical protein [Moraxella sp.]